MPLYWVLAAAAAESRACIAPAYSTTLSTSWKTALAASSSLMRSIHAASSGALPASINLSPESLSVARTHGTMLPSRTSTYPTQSPPKKPFPLEHSLRPSSRGPSAAAVCLVHSALSSSVFTLNTFPHGASSLSST
uniref:Uncharacterized protein n=1 Tax=Triticum urartu TaxID=4572 RepID=A0A8R7NYY7_TRIUA